MTKAPDRIWARLDDPQVEPGETTGKWVDHGPGEPEEKPYLLSTPAREAAEELLDACENWVELIERTARENKLFMKLYTNSQMDFMQGLEETRAAIAKAKGEA